MSAIMLGLSRLFARHAFPLCGFFVSPPSSCALYTPGRCRWLAGWTSDDWVGAYTDGRLAFHFAFHFYCLHLAADRISPSSIPPCTTRVIMRCSWLLLVVLELLVVVGMWLSCDDYFSTSFSSQLVLSERVEHSPRCPRHPCSVHPNNSWEPVFVIQTMPCNAT
jgi:hypothetical protein